MKIALVCDWLVTYAGAERVIEKMIECFPHADLFSVVDFVEDRNFLKNKKPVTTFIQKLPKAKKKYRGYLPLMPLAIEQLDLSNYDVIISSSHAVAKGVITGPDQLHISYIHSPMRYAWDLQHQYLKESGLTKGLKGWLAKWMLHKMRLWDVRSSFGVDYFIANSDYIGRRINKVYRRQSITIYPPVSLNAFECVKKKEDFYLTCSRMVPYKKIDLIVEAFSQMPNKKLIVLGDGPDFKKIAAKAGSNVQLLGYQKFAVLKSYMQRAKAFVFAAEEDFGIIPVEAQACGTPVIAYRKGGVLETVQGYGKSEKPTGIFFDNQSVESITSAVTIFEKNESKFKPEACRKNAELFSEQLFKDKFSNYINDRWLEFLDKGTIS
ncbi:GDP-mannose-dependent alpha-(1-6)-phosphatidylinositol monomannoside mannosyltransferase [Piscirickettsia salmonis]|uniref:glycosyltransferase family 4 protein n=1 Tax=Piscirickettsia salmonis TaxID=1238 RepID=UPI0012B78227|nr:glycosyltransferase family 4 protein [Piscirickettsia salmonis]QGP48703.1 GDP-mannose-dependent alpha-(1-6)-phosphatidylinositol monomannoside mannosyltransferase [Piscirickettsia salmonis]QGP52735.1 GDP-mannose-dependent alpha-(1-6)-phosphatidylinositol monomannoside mannosyltransferase [Piscirickettsia salmonis]QGP57598.1 GDP-mannose-dependent alpha-(1-6)-phosphatidylinositol monomannoside mannosyltransferase [Piscirickettsia salmonis]QGP62303.1 GDP-mannose-dependent alpha-(1-6)-phosphatid